MAFTRSCSSCLVSSCVRQRNKRSRWWGRGLPTIGKGSSTLGGLSAQATGLCRAYRRDGRDTRSTDETAGH
jgi:hypothetical protein